MDKDFPADDSKSLMSHLLDRGIPVASSCQGEGICGKCVMTIKSGHPLPHPSALESTTLAKNSAKSGERLSCQHFPDQDIKVFTDYW